MSWIYTEHEEEMTAMIKEFAMSLQVIASEHGVEGAVQYVWDACEKFMNEPELQEKMSCRRGCSFCCHQTIFISPLEAKIIKDHGVKPEKIRLRRQKGKDVNTIKWKDRACPFLSREGECKIYAVRPLVCRTHNSIEDPKYCHQGNYPGRSIQEGRSLEVEALILAFHFLQSEDHENPLLPMAEYF